MATRLPTIFLVAALSVLLPLAYAAECTGSNPSGTCGDDNIASRNEQYTARQNYCSNNLWQSTRCYVEGNVKITFDRPGSNNQQTCWDALDDIINHCGSYVRGSYNLNGLYGMTRCAKNDGFCSSPSDEVLQLVE